ncbi:MAG: hypothetical protein M3068_01230 [Gemmatimonadota bacterium]|nr:hypothetical protein [Gemmatimonadota bacterium]
MTARHAVGLALTIVSVRIAVAAGTAPSHGDASGPIVTIAGPTEDTLRAITPAFTLRGSGFADSDHPITLRAQIAREPSFAGPLLFDSATRSPDGDSVTVTLRRPLPQGALIYWRALAISASGTSIVSTVHGPQVVPRWLSLLSLNAPNGSTVESSRPSLFWTSPELSSPPGPWVYDLSVRAGGSTREVVRATGLLDTSFTLPFDLESNFPYRWSVTARLLTGDSVRVQSAGTFVILSAGAPIATLLFQNFPNPFPNINSRVTCIWFDLRRPSLVRLEVLDLRGTRIRTLVPSTQLPTQLPAGHYGRSSAADGGSGCDARFAWDGLADNGQIAPAGVYLLRLEADGTTSTRKMLFRGR